MSIKEHKAKGSKKAKIAIVSLTDTRNTDEDVSGKLAVNALENAGHTIIDRIVIPDDELILTWSLRDLASKIDIAILIGGTGIAKKDITTDMLKRLFQKELSGFGELFRFLSYSEVGSPAMLSRSSAGIFMGMIVFSLPGSTKAVKLALDKLILPEIGHIIYELNKHKDNHERKHNRKQIG